MNVSEMFGWTLLLIGLVFASVNVREYFAFRDTVRRWELESVRLMAKLREETERLSERLKGGDK